MQNVLAKIVIDAPAILIPPVMTRLLCAPVPDSAMLPSWVAYRQSINEYIGAEQYQRSGVTSLFLLVGLIAQGLLMFGVSRLLGARTSQHRAVKVISGFGTHAEQAESPPHVMRELKAMAKRDPKQLSFLMNIYSSALACRSDTGSIPTLFAIRQVLWGLVVAFSIASAAMLLSGIRNASLLPSRDAAFLYSVIWGACGIICYVGANRVTEQLFRVCAYFRNASDLFGAKG